MTEMRSDWFRTCTLRASLWEPEFVEDSDWVEFTPFAFWLVEAIQPRRIVEIGTRDGQSFMAFGQAIDRLGLDTSLFGIGTWQAAGQPSDQPMLDSLRERAARRFDRFSHLMQMPTPDATGLIEDQSVDLLNLVGPRSREQAAEELQQWRPKLSDRAVVLIQATQLREPGRGSFQAWSDLSPNYPSFELSFAGGLGLLGVGTDLPANVKVLVDAGADSDQKDAIQAYYRRLGSAVGDQLALRGTEAKLFNEGRRVQNLAEERAELIAESHLLQSKVREVSAALRTEEDKRYRANQQVKELRNSASWKVTKPIRAVGRARRPRRQSGVAGPGGGSVEPGERGRIELPSKTTREEPQATTSWIRLFDPDWYVARYPDVAKSGQPPEQHFDLHGAAQLRDPNPWFDTARFSAQELLPGNVNPLVAYLGIEPSRRVETSVWFDGEYYCRTHDVAPEQPALEHFLARRDAWSAEFPTSERSDVRKRVVFISGEAHTPGHRYRVADAAEALAPCDYDVFVTSTKDYPTLEYLIRTADVVWMWRVPLGVRMKRVIRAARAAGAVVLGDIDDLVFLPDLVDSDQVDGLRTLKLETNKAAKVYKARGETLAATDLRIGTTTSLVCALAETVGDAVQLPNGYDADGWKSSQEALANVRDDGVIRIGYAGGSLTHQKDLVVAAPAIARVLRENPRARLVLFKGFVHHMEFPELAERLEQIEWRDRVPLDLLPMEYARFSINIAPLELDNPFCDAKSALKFHEAALVNVPTIASPTSPFVESIVEGVNGMLARTEDDWYRALTALVGDATKRLELARQARQDVIWRFGPLRRSVLAPQVIAAAESGSRHAYEALFDATDKSYPRFQLAEYEVAHESIWHSPGRMTVLVWATDAAESIRETLAAIVDQSEQRIDLVVVDANSKDATAHVVQQWMAAEERRFGSVSLVRTTGDDRQSHILNSIFDRSRTPYVAMVTAHCELSRESIFELRTTTDLTFAAIVRASAGEVGALANSKGSEPVVISVEAWAGVGGFNDVSNPIADLCQRVEEFGLALRTVATPTE